LTARQLVQAILDPNHESWLFHTGFLSFIERQLFLPAAALLRVLRAGMINQNLAHHASSYAQEMDSVADVGRGLTS
jgi:hypothetical protein